MLNMWVIPVFEEMLGKKSAALLSDMLSEVVTERTIRNWLNNKTKKPHIPISELKNIQHEKLRHHLEDSGYPPCDINFMALNGFRSVRMAHLEELGYVPRTEPDLTG